MPASRVDLRNSTRTLVSLKASSQLVITSTRRSTWRTHMAALHMAAAAACRGSTSTGGHCCCDNKVMVRNTADLKTCATICAASSYPNCDGEVSIYGRERKATQNGEMVGSFYNYKCGHGAKGGSEASYPDKGVMSSSLYFSFCCCRK